MRFSVSWYVPSAYRYRKQEAGRKSYSRLLMKSSNQCCSGNLGQHVSLQEVMLLLVRTRIIYCGVEGVPSPLLEPHHNSQAQGDLFLAPGTWEPFAGAVKVGA